jgi:hypothetical protein
MDKHANYSNHVIYTANGPIRVDTPITRKSSFSIIPFVGIIITLLTGAYLIIH